MLLRILLLVCLVGEGVSALAWCSPTLGLLIRGKAQTGFLVPLLSKPLLVAQWHAQNMMCAMALQANQSGGFETWPTGPTLVEDLVSNLSNY